MGKAQLGQVQHPHESLDDPARVIGWHQLFQRKREQRRLIPILP